MKVDFVVGEVFEPAACDGVFGAALIPVVVFDFAGVAATAAVVVVLTVVGLTVAANE